MWEFAMLRRATVPALLIAALSLNAVAASAASSTAVRPSGPQPDDQGWSVVLADATTGTGSGPASDQGWS
ncbi:hypothetical protein EEJ42_44715 [Streptomyces botrytidirepellens]|uniref:Uncharacterized protein n=1 Tax=Streptomyces botrytidirepellens TaxID=2486417 RepID=A0A3M8SVE1_9ACTN|nr:hypothetical protein EEJ42_44715 [Streptomyces botrytidirepellens]